MTTGWEVSEKKADRDQREHASHIGVWSHCAARKGEVRVEHLTSLWTFPVHGCLHGCLHACMRAFIFGCLYVNMSVGESASVIRVELEHWASGCMQWICLSRAFSLNPPQWRLLFIFLCVNHPHVSDQTLKRVWQVCLSRITVWCVYESLCEAEQEALWKSLHMGANQCLFLFDFTWNIYEKKQNNLFNCVSSGHPVKRRQTQEPELFYFVKTQELIWPQYGLPAHFAVIFKSAGF